MRSEEVFFELGWKDSPQRREGRKEKYRLRGIISHRKNQFGRYELRRYIVQLQTNSINLCVLCAFAVRLSLIVAIRSKIKPHGI